MADLVDTILPGIPDQLVAFVGMITDRMDDPALATFINVGTAAWKWQANHHGYEEGKPLVEDDGTIRDDILQCVMYWAGRRPAFRNPAKPPRKDKRNELQTMWN